MAGQAQSIFIPKLSAADSAAQDYFTANDAVYHSGQPQSLTRNNHALVSYPDSGSSAIYFAGVIGKDWGGVQITIDIFWVATLTVGDVVWFGSWERDNAIPLGANVDVDSYGPEKSVASTAPTTAGLIQRASIPFTALEADELEPGDPFRLKIRRDGGALLDTLTGPAQLFRVYLQGIP